MDWKPVIAAVHGHIYGAGLILAAESDVIVATERHEIRDRRDEARYSTAVTLFAELALGCPAQRSSPR